MSDGYAIYEIPSLPEWIGQSIAQVNVRAKHNINILGIKNQSGSDFMPSPDHVFTKEEHLLVLAEKNELNKLLKRF